MNDYAEELKNVLWSHSTLSSYENCPYSFYQKKILNEKGVSNGYADAGSYGHKLNELIFSGEMTVNDALNEWVQNAENYMSELSESSKDKKIQGFSDYLADFDESYVDRYDVKGVEMKCKWEHLGYKFIGFIDLLLEDKNSGDLILVDHKSSAPFFGKKGKLLKNMEDKFFTYKKQMYMYCNYVYEKFGKYPKAIVWNHFFDNFATVIDFEKSDLDQTNAWTVETIEKILNDEEFVANKSYFMCNKLCNYREICEYLLEDEED